MVIGSDGSSDATVEIVGRFVSPAPGGPHPGRLPTKLRSVPSEGSKAPSAPLPSPLTPLPEGEGSIVPSPPALLLAPAEGPIPNPQSPIPSPAPLRAPAEGWSWEREIRLLDYPQRRGKSGLLNAAIAETGGEILVLSDANTEYQPDAIRKLVRWFAAPEVHVVCGRVLLRDPVGGKNVDSLYWRYENFLKQCEGRLGALLGANGPIYAIRRSAYVPIPGNTIVDDLVIPLLSKLRHKGRIVYDDAAVAWEDTPASIGSEFRRRVRIGAGAYQSLPLLWRLLNPRHGWTAFAFFSHKLLRWLVPFLLLGMLVSSLFLLDRRFYQAALAAQAAAVAFSLAGAYLPGRGLPSKLLRVSTMFSGMNLALLVGFFRWLTTPQDGTWQRTTREPATVRPEPHLTAAPDRGDCPHFRGTEESCRGSSYIGRENGTVPLGQCGQREQVA